MAALPEYVAPLLDDTPLARAELVAAWDGLSTETQIAVLTARKPLAPDLLAKALDSRNAYVRYLAASRYPGVGFGAASWLWRAYLSGAADLSERVAHFTNRFAEARSANFMWRR